MARIEGRRKRSGRSPLRGVGRPNHATVVAYLGLFVALGGGAAWAAATIGADDIENNAVLSRHIRNGTVGAADVANDTSARALAGVNFSANSLTGTDVDDATLFNDDSLTGTDINEATLATVPSASTAGLAANTQLLQGRAASAYVRDGEGFDSSLRPTSVSVNAGASPALISLGELLLKIECRAGPDMEALALTGASGDTLINSTTRAGTNNGIQTAQDVVFRTGEEFDLMPEAANVEFDDSAAGSFVYANPSGQTVVAGTYLAEETSTRCIFAGNAAETEGS